MTLHRFLAQQSSARRSASRHRRAGRAGRAWASPAEVRIERLEERTLLAATYLALERVSVGSPGIQGTTPSTAPSISDDGLFVAFQTASNLTGADTNNESDIYVRDRLAGTIERVSIAGNGTQGNGSSLAPSISGDGRYVAFQSFSTNLVTGDTNNAADIFVYDRQANTIERVSLTISAGQSNGPSSQPSISSDGRYITFQSSATNLVPGDTNTLSDVFVYDRIAHSIERVSVGPSNTQSDDQSLNPVISGDGRFVAFESFATNLVAGDTNGQADIFVYDRVAKTTERVNLSTTGLQANNFSARPSLSADGRYVAFESSATNLASNADNGQSNIYVYDRLAKALDWVSATGTGGAGNSASTAADISGDGLTVAFQSNASDLVSGDTNGTQDVFVFDRGARQLRRISRNFDGTQATGNSFEPAVNANGRFVAFAATSSLQPGDTNNQTDVYVTGDPLPSPTPTKTEQFVTADFNKDGVQDLVYIKMNNTGSGKTEVHVLDGATNYQTFLLHTTTALAETGDEAEFAVVDYNKDGAPDLVYIKKLFTGTGTTELHVLSGATNFQTFLLQTGTALHETGQEAAFAFADSNKDGLFDLWYIKKNNTASGKTEVHLVDGAAKYQSFSLHTTTALNQTGSEAAFAAVDFNKDGPVDLAYIAKFNTGSGKTELHVMNGAGNFQSFVFQGATALHETGNEAEFAVADFNRDGLFDLAYIAKFNTGSNTTELHVLNGATQYKTFLLQTRTALPETGSPVVSPAAPARTAATATLTTVELPAGRKSDFDSPPIDLDSAFADADALFDALSTAV